MLRFGSLGTSFLSQFCHISYITEPKTRDETESVAKNFLSLNTVNIIAIFLKIHKSIADVEGGQGLYNKYSEVAEEDGGWLSLRETVLARKMSRRMLVQPLTIMGEGGE